jgi:general secretion pathway protein B
MSLILDALRKAERERNLGQTPTLSDVAMPPPEKRKPRRSPSRLRALALAALVLALLALVILFRPQRPVQVPAANTGIADTGEETPLAEAAPPPAAPAAGIAETAPPAPTADDEVQGPQSLDDILDPAAAEAQAEPATVEPDAEMPPDLGGTDAAAAPPQPTLAAPLDEPPAAEAAPQDEAPADAAAPAAEPAQESPQEPEIKRLQDLPADYRSGFPVIKIEVHVYDPNPLKRWFMAGGRKYIEGSKLPEGPRVIEILPEGVVFNYRGETSLLPLKR